MLSNTVNFRNRDDPNSKSRGEIIPLDEIIPKLVQLKIGRSLKQDI